jgi:ArsR family transcriptional regulator, arsenate/arsenite/antimonite-responsive transcriptional repressor
MAARQLEVLDTSPAACCVPIGRRGMSDEDAAATAAVFKALSDPNRVRVINLLATSGEPVCICDLTQMLDVSQPTVSFHMKKLVDAGLLDREQRGIWAYYSLRPGVTERLEGVLKVKEGSS